MEAETTNAIYIVKLWVLGGTISILLALLAFITKKAFDRFISKLDELIKEVQKLSRKDLLIDKEIEQINKSLQEIKEQHERCENYKPRRR
jgi:uncharacterized membrane protein YgaE (UPF0421/DUF939 family)